MVSVGVSELGSTEIRFIEPGVKVNGAYYRSHQPSCPGATARHIMDIPGWVFVFQHDGAHRAHDRDTVAFLERKVLDLIPPTLWPPTSPDLNPVDYSIWSVLQEKVYRSRIANVDELKTRLIDEWARFDQSIVDVAIDQCRRRLSACVRVSGAHFEHKF